MHGLAQIISLNSWARTKAAKKLSRRKPALGPKKVRLQGREVEVT